MTQNSPKPTIIYLCNSLFAIRLVNNVTMREVDEMAEVKCFVFGKLEYYFLSVLLGL